MFEPELLAVEIMLYELEMSLAELTQGLDRLSRILEEEKTKWQTSE